MRILSNILHSPSHSFFYKQFPEINKRLINYPLPTTGASLGLGVVESVLRAISCRLSLLWINILGCVINRCWPVVGISNSNSSYCADCKWCPAMMPTTAIAPVIATIMVAVIRAVITPMVSTIIRISSTMSASAGSHSSQY